MVKPTVVTLRPNLPEYLAHTPSTESEPPLALFARFQSTPRKVTGQKRNLPGCWTVNPKSQLVELEPGNLIISYKGPGKVETDGATLCTSISISRDCGIYYFETKILSKGRDGYIGVGFTTHGSFSNKLPGLTEGSWGYHAADGKKFSGPGSGALYGPSYSTGDVIGCCVNFADSTISYTRNGIMLGIAFKNIFEHKPNAELYPCVGLRTPGERVSTNFGKDPFVFDIKQFYQDEKMRLWKSIESVKVESTLPLCSIVNKLILEWLVKNGYFETAQELFNNTMQIGDLVDETGNSFERIGGSASVQERKYIQELILTSNVNEAFKILSEKYPSLFVLYPMVHAQLHCLVFVDMVKNSFGNSQMKTDDNDVLIEIVSYARQMKEIFRDSMNIIQEAIEELMSLLCYEEPENSPVSYLLSDLNRKIVAQSVNSALLHLHGIEPRSNLELLYQQLMSVDELLAEYQSGSAVLADLKRNLIE